MHLFIKLMIFFLTFLPRMADNLLYSLYIKSSLYKSRDNDSSNKDNFDFEIDDEKDELEAIKNQKNVHEPNNRHSMYVDINVSSDFFFVHFHDQLFY